MPTDDIDALFDEVQAGSVAGVPGGTYKIRIDDTRVRAESNMFFVSSTILEGPLASKPLDFSIVFPTDKGDPKKYAFARKMFVKKMHGFDIAPARDKVTSAMSTGDVETALEALADTVDGQVVEADIERVDSGNWAGTNNILASRPVEGNVAATPTVVARPQPTPVEEAAGEDPAPVAASAAATAADEDVEF